MKKIIRRIIFIIIVIAAIVASIVAVYRYQQTKKTAKVVPLTNYGMDSYWGDSLECYGVVESEGSQVIYLDKSVEIASVNVAEGDHVNEGDVLYTVSAESVDLKGKALELKQAQLEMAQEQVKLERYQNATPVPDADKIGARYIEKTVDYISSKTYYVKTAFDNYEVEDKVAEIYYDVKGEIISEVYYDALGHIYVDEYDGSHKITDEDAEDYFTVESIISQFDYTRTIDYYAAETGKYLGSDVYDIDGNLERKFTPEKGYTAEQINEGIETETEAIKKLDLQIRRLQSEYESMQKSMTTGEVRSKVSGTVSKLQDKDNINYNSAFITITATDEYYISGTIGEFYLKQINVGDSVSITCWDNGNTAEATISEISENPDTSGNNSVSSGNQNSSVYPFKATFDMNSGIELGAAVNITISAGQQESGIYIESALIRKDAAGSYVMKKNADNLLEKQYITVGKTLWGSYTEVKEGVSMDDYLAFPYGNGAIEGLCCEEVDYLE